MATEYRQRPGMGDHFDDEDLVMNSAQQRRNWRGILIALMVIVAVLAMIVTSVVLLTPPQPEELSDSYSDLENGDRSGSDYYYNQRANDELWWRRRGMRTLRLSDILSDSASIKIFNGTWISGNEIFYVTSNGDLAVMEIKDDGTVQTTNHIMSKKMLQKLKSQIVSFELSPDRNHVLIGYDAKKLFRYSKTARYTVYTVSTGQMTPIMLDEGHQFQNGTTHSLQPYLLHAQWHKISTAADKNIESMALIVVYRYDVFYVPWSVKLSTIENDSDNEKKNSTVDSRISNTTSSDLPSSTATPNDKYDHDENNSSSKLSSTPWPYGPVRRITTSGSTVSAVGTVSNGIADYLYEMEILKRSPAVWPSSGRYLMYATFDDRRVGEYKYSVYMKGGLQRDTDDGKETENHSRQQKQQRKKKRRRRRIRRNVKSKVATDKLKEDETSEYHLYPEIRTIRYPKANTPNPVVTLSVIVNLDQLRNPQIQPKIRTLTPPPIFQYTDDYYFTAVQWVNDGGVGGIGGADDDKSGASAAEVCVVWLNRAQNTSVTTLCKSPMWMCQETQVINAARAGGNTNGAGGQGSNMFGNDHARRRYRRNGGSSQKSQSEAAHGMTNNNNNNGSTFYREDRHHHRQQHQQHQHGQHQHNGHRSRRRRAGDVNNGNDNGTKGHRQYGGWVDATVGGAGGGVASTGGGVNDGGFAVSSLTGATWWSDEINGNNNYDGDNFAGDDGYAGISGIGDDAGAGYTVAALARRGWETGDKELTPRAPVFAADGQGYVSVAPVRDEGFDDNEDQSDEGGVRLRRPSSKQHSHSPHDRNGKERSSLQSPVGKYFAQVVAVNITKKLLAPLTFGELDDDDDSDNDKEDKKKRNVVTKSWTVVRILAWDQRTNMIYFLAVPSGRGAPHHRHLYAVKFTPAASLSATNVDISTRAGHHHQQQYRKNTHHNTRSRPVCLSCDVGFTTNVQGRERRDVPGKQNRMDEARDDRLRRQHRERWENQQEEDKDNEEEEEVATAEELRRQRNRRQQQKMNNRGAMRHCTYYDAQFSRDGSHYALICLGPSVPYVTLHRILMDDSDNGEDNINGSGFGDEVVSMPQTTQKWLKDPSFSFEFVALIENNTRLQDKYTNRVLLPGTRTFQLRLSGGRKLTTSGGLHFNDPLAAADYYSNGGDQQLHFSTRKRPDSDPLTVAQVRLYLPLGVYDPEADPRPEFMLNHISNSVENTKGKIDNVSETATETSDSPSTPHSRRRRHSSSSRESDNDGSKRQRRQRKQQRHRRYKKLYPLLVVVNSDPGSQAITDRFADRLGYTTGLLCSGSLGRMLLSPGGGNAAGIRYGNNEFDHRRQKGRRNRRSTATRYYSSGHSDYYDDDFYDYNQDDTEDTNNEYVVAVIDPGRGTWARGYESLLALNYGDGNDRYEDISGSDGGIGRILGTADLRDQLEAVEYLLSSATNTNDDFKDNGQGYYSEDRPRGGRGSRDHSRWFSSTSQSNRRYYSDDDDYYDEDEEYDDINTKNDNDDYYYYYYSNGGDNSDYGGSSHGDDFYRDRDDKISRRDRRSTSDTKVNSEALRLPYVDASRVALLGGGPTSPSTPSSIYGGYAAARMALWQTIYGGAPMEKKGSESSGNRKEPVAIHSSFKCAITMAPVCSWRMYASTFAERYYGYYSGNDDTWMSYDRSDLIPFAVTLNDSSLSPSSQVKGINLLVMHGTADTTIHPQHSMMLVRGVMQQQQRQYFPTGFTGSLRRRNINSSASGGRVTGGFPTRTGAIRISQLMTPDADLSNSRMATGVENSFPINHNHQLLHSIYGHISQYLANECFTSVGDGSNGRGIRIRGRRLRKRRRRRWRTGNRDQEKSDNQQPQQRGEEHEQRPQSQRSVSNNDATNGDDRGGRGDRSAGGRYRRHDVDSNQHILERRVKEGLVAIQIKPESSGLNYNSSTSRSGWGNNLTSDFSNLHNARISSINKGNKGREKEDDEEVEVDDDNEGSDEDYDDREDKNDEDEGDSSDEEIDDDE
ncbi:uncharacterized protein LOC112682616 isoform X2 [Sipha flava]|uniref:Uncharacterized protein LOC112682616 isoform X2 n=1 Tax=Sipha flava TaxID=143950 RepID=A0A8B8FFD0_9HEMI|nr:uncharacterized protein LOC112682616 isoform X2 [Sipha flava]